MASWNPEELPDLDAVSDVQADQDGQEQNSIQFGSVEETQEYEGDPSSPQRNSHDDDSESGIHVEVHSHAEIPHTDFPIPHSLVFRFSQRN